MEDTSKVTKKNMKQTINMAKMKKKMDTWRSGEIRSTKVWISNI